MKTLLFSCMLCNVLYSCSSTKTQSTAIGVTTSIVDPLSLPQVAGDKSNQAIYVRDSIYGGLFTYSTTGVVDNAITFKSADGKYWRRLMDDHIYPEWFGASGDGKTDDGPAFQSMMNWIASQNSRTWKIGFKNRCYLINTTVHWPNSIKSTNGVSNQLLEMDGYGTTIASTNPISIFDRMPTDQNNAGSIISNYRFAIKGISFKGSYLASQKAINMHAFYSPEIRDCNFNDFDTAIVAAFWLKGIFSNLMFTNNLSVAIVGKSGTDVWPGATVSNSAFNANLISDCRIYNYGGSFASIMLLAGNGDILRNIISEGASPKYNFYIDYQGSSTVNSTNIENVWLESSGGSNGKGTNFYLRVKGTTLLKNINRTLPDTLFKISDIASGSTILFDDLPYMGNFSGRPFNAEGKTLGGSTVFFQNMPIIANSVLFDTSFWAGGVIPYNVHLVNSMPSDNGYNISSSGQLNFNAGIGNNGLKVVNMNGDLYATDNTYSWGGRGSTVNYRPKRLLVGTDGIYTDKKSGFFFGSLTDTFTTSLTQPEENIIRVKASGGIDIGRGNTTDRKTAYPGRLRYNTDSAWFEGYDGAAWKLLGKGSGSLSSSGGPAGSIREYTVQTKEARKEIMIASLLLDKDKLTRYKLSFLANGASDNDAANFESIVLVRTVGTNGTLIGKITQLMPPILSGSFDGSTVRADVSGNYLSVFVNPGSYGRQANWVVRVDKLSR